MIKQIKEVFLSRPYLFGLLAFLLPLLFYGNVLWGRSFGFDCAPGVMGNNPAYLQDFKDGRPLCMTILDPGAYIWQHPAHWIDVIRHYLNGELPLWTQHIGLGFPLAANFQSSAFFILGFPFWLMFYLSGGNLFHLDLFFVFRYMMMSLGMYLFLRSFGIKRLVAYIGSVLFFNAGYFVLVPNIAHHSVDMLLPFVGWTINKLYFTKEKKWLGAGIIVLGLSMLAGMPESSIFTLFFAALYVVFLALAVTKQKLKNAWLGVLLVTGGLLMSSLLYLPGLEYLSLGMSTHHDGTGVEKSLPQEYISTFVFPELFGGVVTRDEGIQNIGAGKYISPGWNYAGYMVVFFALASLLFLPDLFREKKKTTLPYFFFLSLTIILVLQEYNYAHIFIFEQFPVFVQTQFSKYSSALLNFSLITTACLFIAYLSENWTKKHAVRIGISGILAIGACIAVNTHYMPRLLDLTFSATMFGMINNLFSAVFFIAIVTIAYLIIKDKTIVTGIVLVVVILEMYSYLPKGGDMNRRNSLTSVSPGIKYLLKHQDTSSRILGIENLLYPNLADVYGLNDMRMLDAIWTERTYYFYKHFFTEPDFFRVAGIYEGSDKQVNILTNPFFDLFSVKHIISYSPIESFTSGPTIQSLLDQYSSEITGQFNKARFDIKGDVKEVLFLHPPADKTFSMTKPAGAEYLILYPMLDPQLFIAQKGDGVTFKASITDENGVTVNKAERFMNSAVRKQDRVWKELRLGPLPQKNQTYTIQLRLQTDPGKTYEYDWAGWAGFYWDNYEKKSKEKFKLVYNGEMNIYQNKLLLPRIHFVDKTICVSDDKKNKYQNVISIMNQEAQQIRNVAVVESDKCESKKYISEKRRIQNSSFTDNSLSFTYSSPTEQYIVIQDAFYPGWNVWINGKRQSIDPVNLTFRGFKVPAGSDVHVVMRYIPWSFILGFVISVVTLGGAIIVLKSKKKIE